MIHYGLPATWLFLLVGVVLPFFSPVRAIDYPYKTAEPQKVGWPLTAEERAYVLKPEYERRPGAAAGKPLPSLWPVVPSAGFFGGTAWLDLHARLVDHVKENKGPIDILLVGDSITQQWGNPLDGKLLNRAWQKHFSKYRAVNLGIGGDKTQNVLWRLDHGGVEGIEPRLVVLLIGNNNMFFTRETGVEAAARGIKMCADNLRERFPKAGLIVVKVFPAHAPGNPFYEDIRKTNAALDKLKLETAPRVRVLDLTADLLEKDGTLKPALFTADRVHLSEAGYALYADRLQPAVARMLADRNAGAGTERAKAPQAVETDARLYADGKGWRLDRARVTDPKRPRVLLIGDSILNGYSKSVIAQLEGKAYVDAWVNPYHQSERVNQLLAEVLANGPYDVVHCNMGLHGWQKGRIKEGTFEPLTRAYVQVIRDRLPRARIIWASSTPVTVKGKPGELFAEINDIIVEHNRLAAKVMKEISVPVNDFYALLAGRLELARGDQFHWKPEAYRLLADQAAATILRVLAK